MLRGLRTTGRYKLHYRELFLKSSRVSIPKEKIKETLGKEFEDASEYVNLRTKERETCEKRGKTGGGTRMRRQVY